MVCIKRASNILLFQFEKNPSLKKKPRHIYIHNLLNSTQKRTMDRCERSSRRWFNSNPPWSTENHKLNFWRYIDFFFFLGLCLTFPPRKIDAPRLLLSSLLRVHDFDDFLDDAWIRELQKE